MRGDDGNRIWQPPPREEEDLQLPLLFVFAFGLSATLTPKALELLFLTFFGKVFLI
jgi:hypothetical protein